MTDADEIHRQAEEIEKLQAEVLSNMLVRKDLFDTVQELRAEACERGGCGGKCPTCAARIARHIEAIESKNPLPGSR